MARRKIVPYPVSNSSVGLLFGRCSFVIELKAVADMQTGSDKCRNCGSTKIAHGRIDDAGFKVKVKWTRFLPSNFIRINGVACMDCGYLSNWIEPENLKSILGEHQNASE